MTLPSLLTRTGIGLLLAGVAPNAPSVPLPPYAAIAYSAADGIYGIKVNALNFEIAEQEAMASCAVINGGQDCQIVAAFDNACAALAIGDRLSWGVGVAATTEGNLMPGINLAFRMARQQCVRRGGGESCRLEQAFCSFGVIE